VLLKPFVYVVKKVLLAPKHPGQCLTHHIGSIFADTSRRYRPIERVRLELASLDDLRELCAERFLGTWATLAQPQPDDCRSPSADLQPVMRGGPNYDSLLVIDSETQRRPSFVRISIAR
jgi:hypothetical protein